MADQLAFTEVRNDNPHLASPPPSVSTNRRWTATFVEPEIFLNSKVKTPGKLSDLEAWHHDQLQHKKSSEVADAGEPPAKRVKLAAPDVAPLQLSGLPLAHMQVEFRSSDEELHFDKEDRPMTRMENAAITLLAVDHDSHGTVTLTFASLEPKGNNLDTILVALSSQSSDADIIGHLDLVAQLHRWTRVGKRAHGDAYATALLSGGFTQDRQHYHFSLECCIWWPDGVSGLTRTSPAAKAMDMQILSSFCGVSNLSQTSQTPCSAQDFYDSVHVPPKDIVVNPAIVETGITTKLFEFQQRAVQWMLDRETGPSDVSPSGLSFRIAKDADNNDVCISDLEAVVISPEKLQQRHALRGGILSEEMGLGKTCELLSLTCVNTRRNFTDNVPPELKPTGATLIVTPNTILQQWKDEIARHAPHLKTVHYTGMAGLAKAKKSEKDAMKLFAEAHVVVTTYNVLTAEVHFAVDPPDRSLRGRKTSHQRKKSPLVQMHWWRVVLDEAQMVESGVSNAATTATLIPRSNAWAVSGTPVKKDVQDLRGLLTFLRVEPFASSNDIWKRMVYNYESHFRDDFHKLFSTIALRHTKDSILSELKLPPQRRIVVTIPFTTIEEQNYARLFEEMAADCGMAVDGSPLNGTWEPDDEKMRAWLVRLRQTCLHPQVGRRNRRALGKTSGAPIQTVQEVLNLMIEQTEGTIRVETRNAVTQLCLKGHIMAYAKDVTDRAKQAIAFYNIALGMAEKHSQRAREELKKAGGAGLDDVSDSGEKDEDETPEHTQRGKLRTHLRTALELQHTCSFYVATAYFQIKTTTEGLKEGDDEWKTLEEQEILHYDKAKMIRKEILRETSSLAELTMSKVDDKDSQKTKITFPRVRDLEFFGGIESSRVFSKAVGLERILDKQTQLINNWRGKIKELLLTKLVDVDDEDTTGEEYEASTKNQDEVYMYFDAFRAIVADRSACVNGQINALVNHEMDQLLRQAKRDDHEDELAGREPPESRTLLRELLEARQEIRQKDSGIVSLRGLLYEARNAQNGLDWNSRSQRETGLLKQVMKHLQTITDGHTKLLQKLTKDQEIFRTAMNHRLEFYRQLQQISDAVRPYKEEMDETLDSENFLAATEKAEFHQRRLATFQAKLRFEVHLRDGVKGAGTEICVICQQTIEEGVLTICGHQYCKECIARWWHISHSCPTCKRRLHGSDFHAFTYKSKEVVAHEEAPASSGSDTESNSASLQSSRDSTPGPAGGMKVYTAMSSADLTELNAIDLPGSRSFGTKIDTIARHLLHIRRTDPGSKTLIFSQFRDFLSVLSSALTSFGVSHINISQKDSITRFREDSSIEAFLLDAKTDSSGLNLVNATNVMLAEPLVNPAIELQAIARVHRIGQTRPTSVFMYLVKDTVEHGVYAVSVARRAALLAQRQRPAVASSSRASGAATPAAEAGVDVDRAERLELQAGGLEKLLAKSGGEQVRSEDLWDCLFSGGGGAAAARRAAAKGPVVGDGVVADGNVGRFIRGQAAEARRAGA